jgi:hypothetical protein
MQMIAEMVNMDKEMVRQILHYQLNMKRLCVPKIVLKIFTYEQKDKSEKHFLRRHGMNEGTTGCA